jgi:serine/threonine protein kinase
MRKSIQLMCLRLYLEVRRTIERHYCAHRDIRHWRQNKEELLKVGEQSYRIRIEELGLSQENLVLLQEAQQQQHEVVIGEFDQDGFLLSLFGPIRDAPTVSESQFIPRNRLKLTLVAVDGYAGVRKDYRGNRLAFVHEIKALHRLGLAGSNVPAIMDLDFDGLTLTLSYIVGPVLREELAKRGAVVRDRDVNSNSRFVRLRRKERWLERIQEGKRVLFDVVDTRFIEDLFIQLKLVHASGFIWNDIKYGNVIIEKRSGNPYLIDFESARYCPELGQNAFQILCNENIERFRLHFCADEPTDKRVKDRFRDGRAAST